MLLFCALKTDKLAAGNVNRPLDLDDNFNLSLKSPCGYNYIEKVTLSHDSWRGPLVPQLSIFGGDASHGSHRTDITYTTVIKQGTSLVDRIINK